MKKLIGFIIAGVAILLLLVISLLQFNSLKRKDEIIMSLDELSELQSEEVEQLKEEKYKLETELSTSEDALLGVKEELEVKNQEVLDINKIIDQIDKMLEGNGVTIVKVEELLATNKKLEDEVAKLMNILDEMKAQSLVEEETESVEEAPIVEYAVVPTEEWSQDITDIITFVDKRKSELNAAADTLPTLSLERIMINQEVEFLDNIIVDLEELMDKVKSF